MHDLHKIYWYTCADMLACMSCEIAYDFEFKAIDSEFICTRNWENSVSTNYMEEIEISSKHLLKSY